VNPKIMDQQKREKIDELKTGRDGDARPDDDLATAP